jgi:hypothetical protein
MQMRCLPFSKNEWFTRVWVFQELIFASNPWVQCGRLRAKWEAMYTTLEKELHIAPSRPREIVSQMQQAWKDHHITHQKTAMVQLIRARRGLSVSDPRDMVFAHVGFAVDGEDEDLAVDYSKTTVEVFTDFAKYIAKYGLAILLNFVDDNKSQRRPQDLPSWVPDLTIKLPTSPTTRLPIMDRTKFGT